MKVMVRSLRSSRKFMKIRSYVAKYSFKSMDRKITSISSSYVFTLISKCHPYSVVKFSATLSQHKLAFPSSPILYQKQANPNIFCGFKKLPLFSKFICLKASALSFNQVPTNVFFVACPINQYKQKPWKLAKIRDMASSLILTKIYILTRLYKFACVFIRTHTDGNLAYISM